MAQLRVFVAGWGLGWCLFGATLAGAQTPIEDGFLRTAIAAVDLTSPDSIRVTMDFQMQMGADQRSVPLVGLSFGQSGLEHVEAFDAEGRVLAFRAEEDERGRVSVVVQLPPSARGGFRLAYEIVSGVSGVGTRRRYTIPLLVPEWPPAEAVAGVFELSVALGAEERVVMSFPAGLRAEEGAEGARYAVDLQVVPTLLTLTTSTGSGAPLTLAVLLDVMALVVFLGAGIMAVRHLKAAR